MASIPSKARRPALLLLAILALAVNLRLSVNALGALLPQIRSDLGLPASAAGVLNSLPTLVFAFAGIATPVAAARLGPHRMVVLALLLAIAGQLLRAVLSSTAVLFAGTAVTLAGLAVGNVLLPGLVRQHFPDRIPAFTALYVTVLTLGAAVGSGGTLPVERWLGGNWQVGFAVWAGVAVLAVLPWLLVVVRFRSAQVVARRSSVQLRRLLPTGLAWAMAGFFGLQSAHVYVAISWLGEVLLDAGIPDLQMGLLLALPPAIGIALALVVPVLIRQQRRIGPLIILFGVSYLVGYLGLLLAPATGAWAWMFFIGLGGGTFPTVLTLMALRARTPDGVIALSAFSQCFGYLLASAGPFLFGLLHTAGSGWRPSLILMMGAVLPMVVIGLRLAIPRFLEDQLGADGPPIATRPTRR